ncbi:MAG: glycerophosphodiester phosphodiesterase family protein [Bacteroidales bacterium]|nr:glycerophosphodiester phosphodiesterase family protein [Bacteroidales bacterium]MBQ1937879.1 glycerophosphodiester phosphodiesterase family protein [Bacteroidales bacterium]
MKTIVKSLLVLVAGCLMTVACTKASDNGGGGNTGGAGNTPPPSIPGGDIPGGGSGGSTASSTTLLSLLDGLIEDYNYTAVPAKKIFLVAHRANTYSGYLKGIPENSIPAIEEAIKQGSDMVELDVRPTSDGVLMIMHDESVAATTNGGNKLITNMTYDQVKALKMKARGSSTYYNNGTVKVPTLKEALAACKDKIYVNLDLSGKNCSPTAIVRAIAETGTVGQVMIFGAGGAKEQKEYIEKGYNLCGDYLAIHPYISKPDDINNYDGSYYGCAKLFQYSYSIYYDGSIANFGSKCHANGGLSYSNALDTQGNEIKSWYDNYGKKGIKGGSCKSIDRFIASGSDFLQVDYHECADMYLKEKGLR